MAAINHPLLTPLASLTRQELAQQVTYLKAEKQSLKDPLGSQRSALAQIEASETLRVSEWSIDPRAGCGWTGDGFRLREADRAGPL